MGTYSVLMTFGRCSEIDSERSVVCDGFDLYDICTGEAYGLEKESIQATKRI